KLFGYSERKIDDEESNFTYRWLYYKYSPALETKTGERKFLDLAKTILNTGKVRENRTGIPSISLFGTQLRFSIENGDLPLLTTRKIPFKSVVEELLFFCRGDTDTKILENRGVPIWKGNTSREFLDNRGLQHYDEGIMGNMYGWSWRNFGAPYSQELSNTSTFDIKEKFTGFDQLSHVEHLLKTDPFSRRIYISNLNPSESKNMCLDMCHTYIQFYVTEEGNQKYLSGYFTMRSSDYALAAVSFNTISYALLVNILALRVGMKPKEIIYNAVDCHIYKNHVDGMLIQLQRTPRPMPKIRLCDSLKTKDWSEMV